MNTKFNAEAAWFRYTVKVEEAMEEFTRILLNQYGIDASYLPPADQRRVLELKHRLKAIGLEMEEGIGIILRIWGGKEGADSSVLPVRLWTMLSEKSLKLVQEEGMRLYPFGIVQEEAVEVPRESFSSVAEWTNYLRRSRMRVNSQPRRPYRK